MALSTRRVDVTGLDKEMEHLCAFYEHLTPSGAQKLMDEYGIKLSDQPGVLQMLGMQEEETKSNATASHLPDLEQKELVVNPPDATYALEVFRIMSLTHQPRMWNPDHPICLYIHPTARSLSLYTESTGFLPHPFSPYECRVIIVKLDPAMDAGDNLGIWRRCNAPRVMFVIKQRQQLDDLSQKHFPANTEVLYALESDCVVRQLFVHTD